MNKSNKFSIIVDTNDKVPNLVEAIRGLGFVERTAKLNLTPALLRVNKLLVFDEKEEYDYEIEDNNPLISSWLGDIFGKRYYKTSSDLNKILIELSDFAGKKKQKKDMTIDITITRTRKPRKNKVRVFTNFVKVGWDQYSIKHDWLGNEYVVIKGTRYEIMRNIFGDGYLVEL